MPQQPSNIIFGGTGAIGTELVKKLNDNNEKVISLSRNIPLKKIANVKYETIDLSITPKQLLNVLGNNNIIYVLIGQNHSLFNMAVEQEMFARLLTDIKKSAPQKIIFASSALVYGECKNPANENQVLRPIDSYSKYKKWCEQQIIDELKGYCFGILRLANVYGSEKDKGFIRLVLNRQAKDLSVDVNGDGYQERDYIFIDDVVLAILAIKDKLRQADIVNVSTGKSKTLLDVITTISKITRKKVLYRITNTPTNETKISRIDNSKLIKNYDCSPLVDLEAGVLKISNLKSK